MPIGKSRPGPGQADPALDNRALRQWWGNVRLCWDCHCAAIEGTGSCAVEGGDGPGQFGGDSARRWTWGGARGPARSGSARGLDGRH